MAIRAVGSLSACAVGGKEMQSEITLSERTTECFQRALAGLAGVGFMLIGGSYLYKKEAAINAALLNALIQSVILLTSYQAEK